jgi:hypothetical protein
MVVQPLKFAKAFFTKLEMALISDGISFLNFNP